MSQGLSNKISWFLHLSFGETCGKNNINRNQPEGWSGEKCTWAFGRWRGGLCSFLIGDAINHSSSLGPFLTVVAHLWQQQQEETWQSAAVVVPGDFSSLCTKVLFTLYWGKCTNASCGGSYTCLKLGSAFSSKHISNCWLTGMWLPRPTSLLHWPIGLWVPSPTSMQVSAQMLLPLLALRLLRAVIAFFLFLPSLHS